VIAKSPRLKIGGSTHTASVTNSPTKYAVLADWPNNANTLWDTSLLWVIL